MQVPTPRTVSNGIPLESHDGSELLTTSSLEAEQAIPWCGSLPGLANAAVVFTAGALAGVALRTVISCLVRRRRLGERVRKSAVTNEVDGAVKHSKSKRLETPHGFLKVYETQEIRNGSSGSKTVVPSKKVIPPSEDFRVSTVVDDDLSDTSNPEGKDSRDRVLETPIGLPR